MGKTTRTDTYPDTARRRGRAKAAHVTGIAILADEEEWQALAEQNPLFEFASYQSYLVDTERRMRAAARAGRKVLVAPLMPDQFETRADAAGLPRESPRALKEYERFVAELGPLTRPWSGEPIARVLEQLRAHVRAETLQARALPALSAAADLHEDPRDAAQRAMSTAAHVLVALAEGGGDGQHELHLRVSHGDGELEYTLPYSRCGKVIAFPDDGGEHMAVMLLAIASLAERPGTLTLRSRTQPAFFPPRRKPRGKVGTGSAASSPSAPAPATESAAIDSATGESAGSGCAAGGESAAAEFAAAEFAGGGCAAGGESAAAESVLRGWRLGGLFPEPMSEGRLFAFICTSRHGEPVAPAPGTRFRTAFPLDRGPCPSCP